MSAAEQPAAMLSQARKMNGIMFYVFDASFKTMNEFTKFLNRINHPKKSLKIKIKTFTNHVKLCYYFLIRLKILMDT